MRLQVSAKLEYGIDDAADVLVQIETASLPGQTVSKARFDPGETSHIHRIAAEDGVGTRVWLHCTEKLVCNFDAVVDIDRPVPEISSLKQDKVHQLPHEAVRYLMSSRYCPADEFHSFAGAEFGHLSGGKAVVAMSDWIKANFIYTPGSSGPGTTAVDTFVTRRGICRDFAHVMISLARAAAIPARMVSCYGPRVEPPDFHAVAQVWLEGEWHLVDPTGMATPDEIAIIGVGRDAADIAFLTSYGWVNLIDQKVEVTTV
ncbi:transglutaminase family protein [Palleronia sp. LCG004]|uniref:transglutaminase-like domain-containing protein n=1 Tax=Palleronia sp. LCG004 TaxID=3079304 RepID=UPI0029437E38|nr:transglutaminase family protein [Palleronia sp. LCG004]WOI57186.1 transglutaminase family protein [Palleronia sp. LCG004]